MMITSERKRLTQFTEKLIPVIQRAIGPYLKTGIVLDPRHKEDKTPVTEADHAVEDSVRRAIKARYPKHSLLGEELGADEQEDSPICWVIDPIDGTKAFIAGTPTFTTLIAVTYEGRAEIGMIYNPSTKEYWIGAGEELTTYRVEMLENPMIMTLSKAVIGTTDPALFPAKEYLLFERLSTACGAIKLKGDAYLYAKMASGDAPHLVMECGLKPHDAMALLPIIRAAGGVATDWKGNEITLDHFDGTILAAQNPALHRQALAMLNEE